LAKVVSSGLLAFLLVVGVSGCSSEPPVRVLFLGNSYTASNDLPGMVRGLAGSVGQKMEVAAHAPGGWWLRDHVRSSDSLDAIAKGGYDFVVLQEQSMVPADHNLSERRSRPAASSLGTRASQAGASVVMFMTWGHRRGSAEVGHSSYESMQLAIANSYDRLAEGANGKVAPVGAAWWLSLLDRPDIALYQADGSHPTEAGSYLAAAVIAGFLLDVDPTGFDADLGLDPLQAAALREFASRAWAGERPWK
jgi:hypothetical protein